MISSDHLRTEKNDVNFLPYQIKKAHHITYQKFLKYKEPENYLSSIRIIHRFSL